MELIRMMELFIKNMVILLTLLSINIILMTKVKIPILEISSGLLTGVMVAVLGSEVYLFPWFSIFVLLFGLFTVANSIKEMV